MMENSWGHRVKTHFRLWAVLTLLILSSRCASAQGTLNHPGSALNGGLLGQQLFATGGTATVEVRPATAGFTSELHLVLPDNTDVFLATNTQVGAVVNLPILPAGTELRFYIHVTNTGNNFFMGPASRNFDGSVHDAVLPGPNPGEALVGFEDLQSGQSDLDYDDNVFFFTGVIPNNPPIANAGPDQTVECAGATTRVTLDGRGSSDPENGPLAYQWTEGSTVLGTSALLSVSLPDGLHTITLTVMDDHGNTASDTVNINIVDTTPPVISNVSATPGVLWSPNHKMVNVTVAYDVADICDPVQDLLCSLSVSSNEPVNGTGDGNTSADWSVLDAHHLQLRAERAGNLKDRVYTITITCTDTSNNTTTRTVTVTVPHDKGK